MTDIYDKMLKRQEAIISNLNDRFDKIKMVQDLDKFRKISQKLNVLSKLEDIQYIKMKKIIENILEERSKDTYKECLFFEDLELSALENICTLKDMIMGDFLPEKMEVEEPSVKMKVEKMEVEELPVKMEVKEQARKRFKMYNRYKTVGPFKISTSIVPSDETCRYLEYCYEKVEDSECIAGVVDSGIFDVSKGVLFDSLMPKAWLSSFLIDHVVDVLNVREVIRSTATKSPIENWYFPTAPELREFRIDGSKFWLKSKRSKSKGPKSNLLYTIKREELKSTKLIFFPLNINEKHWRLIVFKNEVKKVEVWDSIKQFSPMEDLKTEVEHLAVWLNGVTEQSSHFTNYEMSVANVPQQFNSDDCGVYVCRSMEFPNEVMKFHKEEWVSTDERFLMAIRILNAPENAKKKVSWQLES